MKNQFIEIIGARENNLKNIDVFVPKDKITIFTGVSGSGKSSIVFDTIAQEAKRLSNETYSSYIRSFLPKYSQPNADEISNLSMAIVVDQKKLGGNSRSTVGTITDINPLLRILLSRFATPSLGSINYYSFNDPKGMCSECEGIGKVVTLNLDATLDMNKSLNEGAILLPGFKVDSWSWKAYATTGFFDNDKPIKDYSKEEFDKLVYAKAEPIQVDYKGGKINTTYEGLSELFIRTNVKTDKEKSEANQKKMEAFSSICTCPKCDGKRYNEEVLNSKIDGYSIYDLTSMQISNLVEVLNNIKIENTQSVIKRVVDRLNSLIEIGLGYLSLNRESSTLSGGESQRVKMVKHLSSSLVGIMYIFDEPSVGLHPRDVHQLNDLLVKLRDKGNTVIVVEHDPDVIKVADHVIDVGPHAGRNGGLIVYEGPFDGLRSANTLTGEYFSKVMPIKTNPRKSDEYLRSSVSSLHNLKNVSLNVPKGIFTVITGVAGSGKSTLVNKVFAKEYSDCIKIDQNPVATNSRSNAATYTEVMDYIRKCFATENNVSNSLFSYNSEGGCPNCKGSGTVELNLSFMEVNEVVCDVCNGARFKKEVLDYLYKDKNIVEVMDMTMELAYEFFDSKDVKNKLKNVIEVGLGYLTLGQPLNTLSGGECQRLKLAKELTKKSNIYILDEPTTGLHMSDIKIILEIIDKLVEKGNTVIAIEHNVDIIKQADWIIDLGPDGGIKGGEIVFEGTVENLLKCDKSITAKYINCNGVNSRVRDI